MRGILTVCGLQENRVYITLISCFSFYCVTLYASTVYAVVVCLSVSLCVCITHSGIVSKRLNLRSCKQCHTIAQGLLFDAKDHG